MARSKRPIANPQAPNRAAVRRRNTENPSENLTRDLNEPPPVSGDNPATSGAPMVSGAPDEGSSKQESPKAISSSHVSMTSTSLLDTETMQTEEEEKRLEEEYLQRKEALRKRKEDAERRRREEEERVKREEEERMKHEEEERVKKEEMERIALEEEKKRVAEEERQRAEAARIQEQKEKKEEDERLEQERKRIEEESLKKMKEQIQTVDAHQDKATESVEAAPTTAHSEQTPNQTPQKSRGVVTRSGAAKKPSSSKPKRKAARKGKGLEPSVSSSSDDMGSERAPPANPILSTVGTVHAPSGEPRQFTSPAAKAHYECISTRKLNLERGFDPDFIEANPFIKDRLVAQDWMAISAVNRRANASLVREFYAEASQAKEPFVKVRGKVIDYSPANINRVLGRGIPEPCLFGRFLAKMGPNEEELILREIAQDGRPWNKDGQRRCLYAGSLTTEAAIWFQFLRATVAPTSHDTTLSMHKCAMLYCVLTGIKINLGIVMHGAIYQARTRTKVILPLPCLITQILTDAGVPESEGDQWLVSVKNIGVQTIKKMRRHVNTPPSEPEDANPTVGTDHPTVFIAEEHVVGAGVSTAKKPGTPTRPSMTGKASTSSANPMTAILQAISSLTYKVDLLAAEQKHINRALEAVWMYNRDRDGVVNQMYMAADPLLAAQIPEFPEGVCPTVASEDEFEEGEDEGETESSPSSTPSA